MLGTLLAGRYQVCHILGGGGFGQTYIAIDTQRPKSPKCVVKHLQPVTRNPEFMETARRLFTSEAEILEILGNHTQIPRLLAYFEENQEFFLVQEFIEGHSLKMEMPPYQTWSENKLIQVLQQLLQILDFIHSHQVIHRDIKPENILRRAEDGNLVLIDFGAVKQIQSHIATVLSQTEMTVVVGTPGYMSLEQIQGKPRLNSDLYSLGVVCIQGITGIHPRRMELDANTGEIIWQDKVNISPDLALVLSKMVLQSSKQRYQSAADILNELQKNNFNYRPEVLINSTSPSLGTQTENALSLPETIQVANDSFLTVQQYNELEILLITYIGPIARTLLRRAALASSYEELINNLSVHITGSKQIEFKQKVTSLFQAINNQTSNSQKHSQSNSSPSINKTVVNSQINESFLQLCEKELISIIGPIAVFLVKKTVKSTNSSVSRAEFVRILAAEIPDAQKAQQFQQRIMP